MLPKFAFQQHYIDTNMTIFTLDVIALKNIFFPIITEEEAKLPFYLKGIGIQGTQEHILRPQGTPDFHWIHTAKGKGILHLNDKEYTISENMGFFLFPEVPHEYYRLQNEWETHWIIFDGHAVLQLLNLIGLSDSGAFYLQDFHLIEEVFKQMFRVIKTAGSLNGFQSSVHLYQFLILCRNCISKTNRYKSERQKQLDPVVAFLEHNYHKNPTLDEIAEVIDVTPHHLCRLFKEVFKVRPFVYLTKIRLQKAKELMLESDNFSVKYISHKVGYNDISYFCSTFKEYEGITPTEFRRIHRME